MSDARVFRWDHRVSYAECTVGNHIYHSRYLDIPELARGEFFRSLGVTFLTWQAQDTIFPVIECRLRFKSPARYDELIRVELWVTLAEKIRLSFGYRILDCEESLLVEAATMHVCTSLQDKPKRLPNDLVKALLPFLHSAQEGNLAVS